jgi:hypothetical protein
VTLELFVIFMRSFFEMNGTASSEGRSRPTRARPVGTT